jgi:hypothetical protein
MLVMMVVRCPRASSDGALGQFLGRKELIDHDCIALAVPIPTPLIFLTNNLFLLEKIFGSKGAMSTCQCTGSYYGSSFDPSPT